MLAIHASVNHIKEVYPQKNDSCIVPADNVDIKSLVINTVLRLKVVCVEIGAQDCASGGGECM
jgi:hypothetical protein